MSKEAMKLALDALNDAWGYGTQRLDDKLTKAIKALEEALAKQEQVEPLTDKMILVAARVMNDRQADACNVDKDDQWKIYGQDFIDDARAMLEAAHGIKE